MLQPGQIINDKYRIVRLIGQGGMGEVYEGENVSIARRVAIKVLLNEAARPAYICHFGIFDCRDWKEVPKDISLLRNKEGKRQADGPMSCR